MELQKLCGILDLNGRMLQGSNTYSKSILPFQLFVKIRKFICNSRTHVQPFLLYFIFLMKQINDIQIKKCIVQLGTLILNRLILTFVTNSTRALRRKSRIKVILKNYSILISIE